MEKSSDELHFFPFAYALYNENLSSFCWYCLDEDKAHKRCAGCGTAIFCDKKCQTLAWKDHKFECRALKFNHGGTVPDIEVRLLGRIVVRYKAILCGRDKEDATFYKDRTSRRAIMDIWAHTKNISEDAFAMKKFDDIYVALLRFYEPKALLSRDIIFQLHCRDFINRHAISDKAYIKEVGKGLYLDLCAYDHSCRPNAIYVCDGFRATLRRLNVETNLIDRSATFYSYIDLLHTKQERHKLLKDTWYFNCECERCRDNQEHVLTSIHCPHCTQKPPKQLCLFGEQPYKDAATQLLTCPTCGTTVAPENVVEALTTMRFIHDMLEKTDNDASNREVLEDLHERARRILPDVNIYCCKIVQALIPLVDPDDTKTLLQLHLDVEECLRVCYPHNHPALGFHLRNIGIFSLRTGDLHKAVNYLQEATAIFLFVMRERHSLTKVTLKFLDEALEKMNENNSSAKILTSPPQITTGDKVRIENASEDSIDIAQNLLMKDGSAVTADVGSKFETLDEPISMTVREQKMVTFKQDEQLSINENIEKTHDCEIVMPTKDESKTISEVITECTSTNVRNREENIKQKVEFSRSNENCAAQDGGVSPLRKKHKEFEYAGSLKRRSKKEQLNSDRHHHHSHRHHRRHSETEELKDENSQATKHMCTEISKNLTENLYSSNAIQSSSGLNNKKIPKMESLTITCDNDVNKPATFSLPCITEPNDAMPPTYKALFVDTNGPLGGTHESVSNSGTGVKKKAALKKISPRARTPLPPFQVDDVPEEPINPTGVSSLGIELSAELPPTSSRVLMSWFSGSIA